MAKRYKMRKKTSKKIFKKTVGRTHRFNRPTTLRRGGLRL
jgi:hypothetical protein